MHVRRSLVAAVAAVAAAAVPAISDTGVDVEIRSGDQVQGTLSPAAETETVRFALPGGAKLKAKAAGAKRGPVVGITLRNALGDETGTPAAKGKGASLKHTTLASDTGSWSLSVRSSNQTSAGDYTASASWTSPKKFGPSTLTFAGAGSQTVVFSADVGAKVRVTAVGKSGAVPRIVSITGPDGALGGADDGQGAVKETTPKLTIPVTGDYTVAVEDAGAGGTVAVTVVVTPPKASKRRIDIRVGKLGIGGGTAFARVIGPEGGEIVVPDLGLGGGLNDISGSSVQVPAGVLPSGAAILIGTSARVDGPAPDDFPVGAPVLFAPEGARFTQKVTVTIPVNLALVGGDPSKVRIFVRAANGKVTEVTLTPPDTFDFASKPGFVSFPTSHFSAYQCAGVAGVPQTGNPGTWATVSGATDLCVALQSQVQATFFYAAGGSDRMVHALVQGGVSGVSVVRFAGGGGGTADGTDRLQFDFRGDVTAVFEETGGTVLVGTPTRVFRIATDGTVTRILGTGVSGHGGDNGPGTAAQIRSCVDLRSTIGVPGEVFVADRLSGAIRRVDTAGNVVTEFGTGTQAFGTDSELASQTSIGDLGGFAFDGNGGLIVCDGARLRRLDRQSLGTNVTIAGDANGATGSSGDGGAPTSARFRRLVCVEQDFASFPNEAYIVVDEAAHTIRRIDLVAQTVTLAVGSHDVGQTSPDNAAPGFPILAPRAVAPIVNVVTWLEGNGRIRFEL